MLTIETGTSKQPEVRASLGHMTEASVHLTRHASDYNFAHVMPPLVDSLVDGTLTLEDLLKLHTTYFRDNPIIASSFTGKVYTMKSRPILPPDVYDRENEAARILRTDIRIDTPALQSDFFVHPKPHLKEMSEKLVGQLNFFIKRAPRLQDDEIKRRLYKFHILFGILHIPPDGSGRFIGDINTVAQLALVKKLNEANRKFSPNLISTNGYRSGHQEQWVYDEELEFKRHLIQSIIDKNGKGQDSWLGYPEGFQFSKAKDMYIKEMKDFVKRVVNNNQQETYYAQLNDVINAYIDNALVSGDTWLDKRAGSVQLKKGDKRVNNKYHTSHEFQKHAQLMDTIVALCRTGNAEQVVTLLVTNFNAIKLLQYPGLHPTLIEIYKYLRKTAPQLHRKLQAEKKK